MKATTHIAIEVAGIKWSRTGHLDTSGLFETVLSLTPLGRFAEAVAVDRAQGRSFDFVGSAGYRETRRKR